MSQDQELVQAVRDLKLEGLSDQQIIEKLEKGHSLGQIARSLEALSYMHPNTTEQPSLDENTDGPVTVRRSKFRPRNIFVTVIAIITLVIVGRFAVDTIGSFIAGGKVATARSAQEKRSDSSFAKQGKLLESIGGGTKSLTSAKNDVCYVTHSDSGWFASNWYQDCYLRYVEVFATKLSMDEVREKLRTSETKDSLTITNVSLADQVFGEERTYPYVPETTAKCTLYERRHTPSLKYIPANFDAAEYRSSNDCEPPGTLQDSVGTVLGPVVLDDELSVHAYRALDASLTDNQQNQIWIMYDVYYYHEDLGCGVGLFCENPRPTPTHPSP